MQTAMENRRKRSSRKRLSTVKSDDLDIRASGAESVDSLSNTMFSVQRGKLKTIFYEIKWNKFTKTSKFIMPKGSSINKIPYFFTFLTYILVTLFSFKL